MSSPASAADNRLLLLTTTRRDGEVSCRVLRSADIPCQLCPDLDTLLRELEAGAAAIMLPEEVVVTEEAGRLVELLRRQPVWSDLPVIVLTRTGAEPPAVTRALATLGNVSLVERPVRVSTLLSVIRTALRARQRQYEVRDQLAENERAHRELSEARDAAEAANRAKDQFLAVLSHELRTPLSPVVIMLSSLEEDPNLPAALREDVAMMRRNISLETQLIDDLLDVNRIANGKLRLQLQPVSVHEVLEHALENCRSELSSKGLGLRMQLEADRDTVMADPARLQQVFWNLLKNAAKFTPTGGHVTLRSRNRDDAVEVMVQDTGIGIDAAAIPTLFNAFEQGDAGTAQQFGGLGLGLAICKAVLDLLGGTIDATSTGRNKGASFTVGIPLLEGVEPFSPRSRWTSADPASGRGQILLVEDHVDTARALSTLLTRSGYAVRVAHSAAAALRLAETQAFAILISDIGLPDARGYELMRQLKERFGLPGIALSGYGTEDDIQRSLAAGFSEHIVKPVNLDQVKAAIENLLHSAST